MRNMGLKTQRFDQLAIAAPHRGAVLRWLSRLWTPKAPQPSRYWVTSGGVVGISPTVNFSTQQEEPKHGL